MCKIAFRVFKGLEAARHLLYHLFYLHTLKGIRSVVSVKPNGDSCWETVTRVLSNNLSGYGKFAELEAIAGKHPEYK